MDTMSHGLKRTRREKASRPTYPDARSVLRDRRWFLGLLGKGMLGFSALGLSQCDPGIPGVIVADPDLPDGAETTSDIGQDWGPPPGAGADIGPHDVQEPKDADWAMGGVDRGPEVFTPPETKEDQSWVSGGIEGGDAYWYDSSPVSTSEVVNDQQSTEIIETSDTGGEDVPGEGEQEP
jgi:hypothetical protein